MRTLKDVERFRAPKDGMLMERWRGCDGTVMGVRRNGDGTVTVTEQKRWLRCNKSEFGLTFKKVRKTIGFFSNQLRFFDWNFFFYGSNRLGKRMTLYSFFENCWCFENLKLRKNYHIPIFRNADSIYPTKMILLQSSHFVLLLIFLLSCWAKSFFLIFM